MTMASSETRPLPEQAGETHLFIYALMALLAVTLFRIVVLFGTQTDLFFDEAQYWFWSLTLEGGYFSKPPGIAAVIAVTTGVCGDSEACIRLGAPILYAATGTIAGLLALRMAGVWAGVAVVLLFATMPGTTFAARIISTDAPLMVCWAATLLFYHRYLQTGTWRDALLVGVFVGLGLLSKYAMIYFGFCLAIHALVEGKILRRLFDLRLWVALGLALAVLSPNIIWNLTNDSVTLSHTADNARWGGQLFNPDELAEFFLAQLAILGPIFVLVLAVGLFRSFRSLDADMRFLLAFSVPITVTMCIQALISRANANWAALSFVGYAVLAGLFMARWKNRKWIVAAFAAHLIGVVGLAVVDLNVRDWSLAVERSPFKRVLGWSGVSDKIREIAEAEGVAAIASNSRSVTAELTYYLRNDPWPVLAWLYADSPRNHYEQASPALPGTKGPVLLVTRCGVDFASQLPGIGATGNVSAPITATRGRLLYWAVLPEIPENPPALADCRS